MERFAFRPMIEPLPPARPCAGPCRSTVPIDPPVAGEHVVELGDCRPRAFGVGPDGADDGEKIGAGLDERPAILLRDAVDRTTRHDRGLAPVADRLGIGVVLGGLGRAREGGAEGYVVRTGFGRGDRAVAAGATGHPDNGRAPSGDLYRQLGGALEGQRHGPEAIGGIADIGQVILLAIVVHHRAADADLGRHEFHHLVRERRAFAAGPAVE